MGQRVLGAIDCASEVPNTVGWAPMSVIIANPPLKVKVDVARRLYTGAQAVPRSPIPLILSKRLLAQALLPSGAALFGTEMISVLILVSGAFSWSNIPNNWADVDACLVSPRSMPQLKTRPHDPQRGPHSRPFDISMGFVRPCPSRTPVGPMILGTGA